KMPAIAKYEKHIFAVTQAAFLWLCVYAFHQTNLKTLEFYGYTPESAAHYSPKLDKGVAFVVRKNPMTSFQRKGIMEVWNLTESQVAAPVLIWGRDDAKPGRD